MAKSTTQYYCQSCGSVFPKWSGKCDNCGEWNSLVEERQEKTPGAKRVSGGRQIELTPLSQTDTSKKHSRMQSGMEELDRVLEQHIGAIKSTPPRPIEGAKSAADILNTVDAQLEGEMLEALKGSDEALGEEVSDLMLVFEHLRNVDDRSMQRLIREVSTDDMMIALKGSDPELMDKFLDNMSTRAADMLVEDMEAKGPVKLAEMTEAQKKILVIAKKLEEDGEIMLGRKNDDFVT